MEIVDDFLDVISGTFAVVDDANAVVEFDVMFEGELAIVYCAKKDAAFGRVGLVDYFYFVVEVAGGEFTIECHAELVYCVL